MVVFEYSILAFFAVEVIIPLRLLMIIFWELKLDGLKSDVEATQDNNNIASSNKDGDITSTVDSKNSVQSYSSTQSKNSANQIKPYYKVSYILICLIRLIFCIV